MLRAATAFVLLLSLSASASAQQTIPDIKSLDDLRKAEPVKVADGWEVRLGLADGGEGAPTWKILYCLATHAGEDKEASFKAQINWREVRNLGPVYVKVVRPDDKVERMAPAGREPKAVDIKAPAEGLYAQLISTAFAGDFRIEVVNDKYELVAERKLTVKDPPAHEWQSFAETFRRDTRVPKMEEDKPGRPPAPWCEVELNPVAAMPEMNGLAAILFAEEKKEDKGGAPLPGQIAGGERGACPLELSLDGRTFVIRSERNMITWPDLHLLARWWVNGKAVPAKVGEGRRMIDLARLVSAGREMSVEFGLPETLGKLKPGDKVALQVIYSPEWREDIQPIAAGEVVHALRINDDGKCSTAPLYSNRHEFVITEEMLHPAPAEIADVKTLDDLRKAEPLKIGEDWEVRLGFSDGGPGAETWGLLYCLAKYVGPKKGDRATLRTIDTGSSGISALGPVCFRVVEANGLKKLRALHDVLGCVAPLEGLYVGIVPVEAKGDFVLDVMDSKENVVARRPVRVDAEHEWLKFAAPRATPAEGGPDLVVGPALESRLWPKMDGLQPTLEGDALKEAEGKPLPGTCAPGGIELKIDKGAFVLSSKEERDWDERCMLARWWVNGKPPLLAVEARARREEVKQLMLLRSKECRVAFALPEYLGELKPGDKVAVQVLYSPEEAQYVSTSGAKALEELHELRAMDSRRLKAPMLSNKVEFDVTPEMLAGRVNP